MDVTLAQPRARVYETYRDRLPELVDLLPNIRAIRVVERKEREGRIDLVNEWVGGGDIPAAARAVIRESMLKWTDYATWDEESFTVAWRTEVHAFPGAIQSSGQNRYVEVPEGTRLEIRGTLTCDASKVPAVPRFVARSINGTIEKVFVSKVRENAVAIAKGVEEALASGTRFTEPKGA